MSEYRADGPLLEFSARHGDNRVLVADRLDHTAGWFPTPNREPITSQDDLDRFARQWQVELERATRVRQRCLRCQRPATMNASLGPACDDHYDDLSG